ncbi:MAG TPA: DUF1289 domain-containing protein [Planctomycetota bacterium]|nr:DUF1289 domain-containing protein [Planctomycetota bacterium]
MTGQAGHEGPPASPCTKVCVLDEARGWCRGCRRTLDEIARWSDMPDDQKRAVLAALPGRGECTNLVDRDHPL